MGSYFEGLYEMIGNQNIDFSMKITDKFLSFFNLRFFKKNEVQMLEASNY